MAKKIFITATNTDIGKTYTTKLLLEELALKGFRVGAIKPIETGVINGYCPDGEILLKCVQELNPEMDWLCVTDIVPVTYESPAAPIVASGNEPLDVNKIKRSMERIELCCDILLIEGAGGLFVPVDEKCMMVDFIEIFEASALLVTHCHLGCINDTLLSKKVLQDRGIKHLVAFNCKMEDDEFKNISKPYFDSIGFEVLKVSQNIDTICDVLYNL